MSERLVTVTDTCPVCGRECYARALVFPEIRDDGRVLRMLHTQLDEAVATCDHPEVSGV